MINREATELFEALRLQKLRAAEHILKSLESNSDEDIAVAIEIIEDVYVLKETSEIYEQNKNYDPESKFSINSEEVLNSLCSFLDIWVDNQLSDKIEFCFLSTNKIGKEKTTKRIKDLALSLPKEKIIEELQSKNPERIKKVGIVVKNIITEYYKEHYSETPECQKTIDTLESISEESWNGFLNQINWVFGHQSIDKLEDELLKKIIASQFYSKYENQNQQEQIKSNLLDLLERKTIKKHKYFRLINKAEVELCFSNAIYQKPTLPIDDVHTLWEKIEKPTDFRNLKDKILDVCPKYNSKKINQLERKAAIAKTAETNLKTSTKYLALKYRVFDFCDQELDNLTNYKSKKQYSENEIEEIIKNILKECNKEFEELRTQFDYGIERKGIVMELFIDFIDSCYLSFD